MSPFPKGGYKITFDFTTGRYLLLRTVGDEEVIVSEWDNHADALSARAEALNNIEVIIEE